MEPFIEDPRTVFNSIFLARKIFCQLMESVLLKNGNKGPRKLDASHLKITCIANDSTKRVGKIDRKGRTGRIQTTTLNNFLL